MDYTGVIEGFWGFIGVYRGYVGITIRDSNVEIMVKKTETESVAYCVEFMMLPQLRPPPPSNSVQGGP